MARNSAVAAAQEAFFDRDWSRIRGSVPRARAKQMARAAMGHSPAIFKAIRDGGTHNKTQLRSQLEYLTTKSSFIIDSRGTYDGQSVLSAKEIEQVTCRFSAQWNEGFHPKLGHTSHLLMAFPVGTRGEDVAEITREICERYFQGEGSHFDYIAAVHEDRDHPHAHIVLNRRSKDGEFFFLREGHHFNYDSFREAMVEVSDRYGLRLEATRKLERGITTKKPSDVDQRRAEATGQKLTERERVGPELDRALAEVAQNARFYRGFAKLTAMQRCEVSKVRVCDGGLTAAHLPITRMLREIMRPRCKALVHQINAFTGRDIAYLGRDGFQLFLGLGESRDRHVMIAEAKPLGFQFVKRVDQFFGEGNRAIIACLHQALLALDPAGHDVAVDRREGMCDHHVDRQVQLIEHGAVGLGRVGLYGKAGAKPLARRPIVEREASPVKRDARVGHIFGNDAKAGFGEERPFLADVERAEETQQLAIFGPKQAGIQLSKRRQQTTDDFLELAQLLGRLVFQLRERVCTFQAQPPAEGRAFQHRECQRFVPQTRPRHCHLPTAVQSLRKPFLANRWQGGLDRF